MIYEYTIIAGRGNSSAGSLAKKAHEMAAVFYGELKFEVEVHVSGKTNDYFVQCTAKSYIEVETETPNGR